MHRLHYCGAALGIKNQVNVGDYMAEIIGTEENEPKGRTCKYKPCGIHIEGGQLEFCCAQHLAWHWLGTPYLVSLRNPDSQQKGEIWKMNKNPHNLSTKGQPDQLTL